MFLRQQKRECQFKMQNEVFSGKEMEARNEWTALLTRLMKQALSTHAPQHPRKLKMATEPPIRTKTAGSFSKSARRPEVGTVRSRST